TDRVKPGDLVLLHDPQTAGLVDPLTAAGALVMWRCHIGVDEETDVSRQAWEFLRPYLLAARGYVFSRRQYVPSWVPMSRTMIIPPSIDPLSPKHRPIDPDTVRALLIRIGVLPGAASATYRRPEGPAAVGDVRTFRRHDRGDGEQGDGRGGRAAGADRTPRAAGVALGPAQGHARRDGRLRRARRAVRAGQPGAGRTRSGRRERRSG